MGLSVTTETNKIRTREIGQERQDNTQYSERPSQVGIRLKYQADTGNNK